MEPGLWTRSVPSSIRSNLSIGLYLDQVHCLLKETPLGKSRLNFQQVKQYLDLPAPTRLSNEKSPLAKTMKQVCTTRVWYFSLLADLRGLADVIA